MEKIKVITRELMLVGDNEELMKNIGSAKTIIIRVNSSSNIKYFEAVNGDLEMVKTGLQDFPYFTIIDETVLDNRDSKSYPIYLTSE